ncbi:MAG: DNA topoisomerase IB [Candidatus Latescibacterota bacterium]
MTVSRTAGLRFYPDSMPGIRRRGSGRGFCYFSSGGELIRDRNELRRIKHLAIPPAWRDVWVSPFPDSHLQATGRDARDRKQYLYHPGWRERRSITKYHRMLDFADALPVIRKQVWGDLAKHGVPKEKVLATVVRLLDISLIRIGNREYVRENKSFGLTTLYDEHVEIIGSHIEFRFRGKGGKEHCIDIRDRRLARIVKQAQDIPGQELFQYLDEAGQARGIESGDVNAYLREITGEEISAKDFRTWGGTVRIVAKLSDLGSFESHQQASKNIVEAVRETARHLGNRPATCRKYYIHPAVIDAYREGKLLDMLDRVLEAGGVRQPYDLDAYELTVMYILREHTEIVR